MICSFFSVWQPFGVQEKLLFLFVGLFSRRRLRFRAPSSCKDRDFSTCTCVKLWFTESSSHRELMSPEFHKFPTWVKYLRTLNWIICLCISEVKQLYPEETTNYQQTLFWNNEFKISNIWTQVYFMQNFLIDGDRKEKTTWCSGHCVFLGRVA